MSKYPYFNPERMSHSKLMQTIEGSLKEEDKIRVLPLGDNTQHIFKNGKYLITINWNLV
jgi:hypothetical protein